MTRKWGALSENFQCLTIGRIFRLHTHFPNFLALIASCWQVFSTLVCSFLGWLFVVAENLRSFNYNQRGPIIQCFFYYSCSMDSSVRVLIIKKKNKQNWNSRLKIAPSALFFLLFFVVCCFCSTFSIHPSAICANISCFITVRSQECAK